MSCKRFAVVLAGCGVYDGTEVHEASAAMAALSRQNVEYQCFAPDIEQMHVVDHTAGSEMSPARKVLVESARIARGDVKDLADIKVSEYSGVIVPGGFGAAKNLSTWAVDGMEGMKVNEHVKIALEGFKAANKPIAACCIAPVILAKLFGEGATMTLGKCAGDEWPYNGATATPGHFKGTHQECDIDEICVDTKNNFITAPAYMKDAKVHQVHDNVTQMVVKAIELAKEV